MFKRLHCLIVAVIAASLLPPAHGQSADQLQQSADQLYRDAIGAYDRGDVSQAISLYKRLVDLQPDFIPFRANLGVALASVGRYSEAILQYQEALKRDPKNSIVNLNLALAFYKQAEFEKAASALEKLRVNQADNQQALYLLADCYLKLGKDKDVIVLLNPVYEANPEDRAVEYALGTALIRSGNIQRGEQVIDKILKDPNSPEGSLLLGEAQFAAGDYPVAAATLRKALDLNPNLAEGWSLYGRTLLATKDHEEAKKAFQRALELDPNDFSANLYLGSTLRLDGDAAEAAPYVERALGLRPQSPEAQFQIGALDAAKGNLDGARKEFEQIEKNWPDFLEVHVQLAALYSRMNLKEESERERAYVLKLNEKDREKKSEP